ncbi:hypothetical protein FACS189493_7060 [Spirochaetia bacterium]|nr:hypothetical protein FACS189493_7060 [Spirochaetia bacterium]
MKKKIGIFFMLTALAVIVTAVGCGTTGNISGVFEGTAPGMQGPITVQITVSGGTITGIEYLKYSETANITVVAKERVPRQIIEYNSLAVDTVTGATLASRGIINAVADAAATAGLNVNALRNKKIAKQPRPDHLGKVFVTKAEAFDQFPEGPVAQFRHRR